MKNFHLFFNLSALKTILIFIVLLNLVIGFLSQALILYMIDNQIDFSWRYVLSAVLILFTLFSIYISFKNRKNDSFVKPRYISIFLAIYFLFCILSFWFLGSSSPILFLSGSLYLSN